jgi:DnaJ-domain-containing protein 1
VRGCAAADHHELAVDRAAISPVDVGRQHLDFAGRIPPDGPDEEQNSHRAPELDKNLKTLNLNLGAKPERIRKAYLEAVKKYHPDKFSNRPPEMLKDAEEKTKQINTAYSILKKA